jgi:hypothetical protein
MGSTRPGRVRVERGIPPATLQARGLLAARGQAALRTVGFDLAEAGVRGSR